MNLAFSQSRFTGIPDDAYCLSCGYALRGLNCSTCPECGKDFHPNIPETYATSATKRQFSSRTRSALFALPFLLVVVLAAYVCNANIGFTLWISFPLLISYCVAPKSAPWRQPSAIAGSAFACVATGLTALFCLAWVFDWGKTATGSSTAGLAFIFLPLWVIGLGIVAAIISFFVAAFFLAD